ncbi:hypothetical protein [Halorarum salinum]|uniref:Uncharacterized protein n=1 Tax=Halorarum salinum TaxID=2743089 RepID=A0A7D5LAP9_9EURY|nr:hypothetical protein [Halobaculum salinum]QLG61954.1 hypothetical protein HUG12_09575 [Halobaculum salinum]
MANIALDGGGNGTDYDEDELHVEPLQFKLKHNGQYKAKIGHVSDIYPRKAWGSDNDDEKEDVLQIYTYIPVDELGLDDEKEEAVLEQVEAHREEIAAVNERREEIDWDTLQQVPEGHIPMKMYTKASLTRSTGSYNNAKLYDTLFELGLAEGVLTDGEDKGAIQLYDRDGEPINPFEPVDLDDNDAVNAALENYLRQNLLGMEVEIQLKNANRDNPEKDEYSTVKYIIGKVDDPLAEAADESGDEEDDATALA